MIITKKNFYTNQKKLSLRNLKLHLSFDLNLSISGKNTHELNARREVAKNLFKI